MHSISKMNIEQEDDYPLRPPEVVMDIKRLGSMHQSSLSFMRELMRKIMRENWQISHARQDLDEHGYGTVVYTIQANKKRYSYVLFSDYLADEDRNDRVIAEKWDVTMTLCIGDVSPQQLEDMRLNVPKQEAGRARSNMLVLSRGNKSSRNFSYVVDELAAGRQPSLEQLAKVGYLYRTTAVYGSGKFGMADWQKVIADCPEFASPFAAEMFSCFLLRQFSIEQAEHLARIKSPNTAVALDVEIKRYIGIGNSTGLGMAPFLIRHPKVISQWILTREKALARVIHAGEVSLDTVDRLKAILTKAFLHIAETSVPDEVQTERNTVLKQDLLKLQAYFDDARPAYHMVQVSWMPLIYYADDYLSLETQELLNSALMELHPELVDECHAYPCVDERYEINPEMRLGELKSIFESSYAWALDIDFTRPEANHYFWYRSQEKMEPRIGSRFSEPGQEKEMPLPIARLVRGCYDKLSAYLDGHREGKNTTVAEFLFEHPDVCAIVKRAQTMSQECYGEIRVNLADEDMLPLDLLRCKLAFFGVSKFDPKSKLWVRNTMFQGAPVAADIGQPYADDWYFPVTGNSSGFSNEPRSDVLTEGPR